jgi:hypothetical protein
LPLLTGQTYETAQARHRLRAADKFDHANTPTALFARRGV